MCRYGSLININPSGFREGEIAVFDFFAQKTWPPWHNVLSELITIEKKIGYDMCVINDPLGQTHSPAMSAHYSRLYFVLLCKIMNSGEWQKDEHTDNTCENSDHYGSASWIKYDGTLRKLHFFS